MKSFTQSSELQRAAEQAENNEERMAAYRNKQQRILALIIPLDEIPVSEIPCMFFRRQAG